MLELRWVFLSPHLLQWWVSHRPEAVPCTQGWLSQPRKGQGSEQWGLLQKLFLQIIWNRWWRWWCNNDEDASIHTSSICSLFIYMESLLSRHRAREQYLFTWPRQQCLGGIQGYSPWATHLFTWDVGFYFFSRVLATIKYWFKGIWDGGGVEMHKIRECPSMIFCASG